MTVIDARTKQILQRISFANSWWRAVFVGTDLIAVATEYGELSLWNPRTGERLAILIKDDNKDRTHYFQRSDWLLYNGKGLLAVGSGGIKGTQIWDIKKRKKIAQLDICPSLGKKGLNYPVAFKGDTLVTLSRCIYNLQVWDIKTGKLRGMIKNSEGGNWYKFQFPDQLTTSIHVKK